MRSSVVPRPGAPTSGGTIIRLAGIICVLCTSGYAPPILYIRRPARLGAAGPSDLTALQNSREVHTLRLATARNSSTPRVWLKRCQLATHPRIAPPRCLKAPYGWGACYSELRRIHLLGNRVNKALARVAHTKKKPEPPCRGLRLRCATSSSLEEVRRLYPTALSG
jgi:hypothetical protein